MKITTETLCSRVDLKAQAAASEDPHAGLCQNKATVLPVLVLRWPRGFSGTVDAYMRLPHCGECSRKVHAKDLVSDAGWKVIADNVRAGAAQSGVTSPVMPVRERSQVRWILIGSPEQQKFDQRLERNEKARAVPE